MPHLVEPCDHLPMASVCRKPQDRIPCDRKYIVALPENRPGVSVETVARGPRLKSEVRVEEEQAVGVADQETLVGCNQCRRGVGITIFHPDHVEMPRTADCDPGQTWNRNRAVGQ